MCPPRTTTRCGTQHRLSLIHIYYMTAEEAKAYGLVDDIIFRHGGAQDAQTGE